MSFSIDAIDLAHPVFKSDLARGVNAIARAFARHNQDRQAIKAYECYQTPQGQAHIKRLSEAVTERMPTLDLTPITNLLTNIGTPSDEHIWLHDDLAELGAHIDGPTFKSTLTREDRLCVIRLLAALHLVVEGTLPRINPKTHYTSQILECKKCETLHRSSNGYAQLPMELALARKWGHLAPRYREPIFLKPFRFGRSPDPYADGAQKIRLSALWRG